MKALILALSLLAGCALTPAGPTSLVRGTVETDGPARIWSDGTALVVLAPKLAAFLESKAPDVWALPPEYADHLELDGQVLLIRFYPFETRTQGHLEPWPAWARGAVPPATAEALGIVWEAAQ